jgi:hypothetical protein
MLNIYFDESGNLGGDSASPGASRYFYLTMLITESPKEVEKVIKKVVAASRHTKRFRGYLHAADDKDETVARGLRYLARKDIKIVSMRINKRTIDPQIPQNITYKKLVLSLIKKMYGDQILDKNQKYRFVASRYYTNRRLNNEFIAYIFVNTTNFNVETEWSMGDKCLQAVDYASAALYRKYEKADGKFYEIIKSLISREYRQ